MGELRGKFMSTHPHPPHPPPYTHNKRKKERERERERERESTCFRSVAAISEPASATRRKFWEGTTGCHEKGRRTSGDELRQLPQTISCGVTLFCSP